MLGRKKKRTSGGRKKQISALKGWRTTIFSVLICAAALNFGAAAAHRSVLQRGIAEEVLRFHVLANSDSVEDQRVKYLVRDAVMEWISRSGAQEEGEDADVQTKESEMQFLSANLRGITEIADRILQEQGMPYRAQAAIENCYFPERTYGDCTFPAGWYDALRVRLGRAEGQNWWCVLYPGLCFSDCLHAVADDGARAELKEILTAEEYESLLKKPKKWRIAFRWF